MKGRIILGFILICIGLLLLLNLVLNFRDINMAKLWPVFMLIPGVILELNYLICHEASGVLIPGGILTVLSAFFFFQTFTDWAYMQFTWPIIILAVALGLFQFYLGSGRPEGVLVPVTILASIGLITLAFINLKHLKTNMYLGFIVAVIFLISGGLILFRNKISKEY